MHLHQEFLNFVIMYLFRPFAGLVILWALCDSVSKIFAEVERYLREAEDAELDDDDLDVWK